MRSVHSTFENYVKLNKRIPPEMLMQVRRSTIRRGSPTPSSRTCRSSSNDKQAILETESRRSGSRSSTS